MVCRAEHDSMCNLEQFMVNMCILAAFLPLLT